MIEDIKLILEFSDADLDLFRKTVHRLFSTAFIIRGIPEDAELYSFAILNRDAVDAYCECAGWILRVDETIGVVSWKGPSSARWLLSKDETVFLVILRLLYEEKRHEISLLEFPVSTIAEITDRYRSITSRQMRKTRLIEVFRRLMSLRLIKFDMNDLNPDALVIIYPSVAQTLDTDSVNSLYEKIKNDRTEETSVEEDEKEEPDNDTPQ